MPEAASRAYSTLELECLAIYTGVLSFKHLIGNRHFIVETDHKALQYLFTSTDPPPTTRVQRFVWKLQPFSFTVKYVKDTQLPLADFLSRHPRVNNDDPLEIIPEAIDAKEYSLDSLFAVTRSQARAAAAAKQLISTKSTPASQISTPVMPCVPQVISNMPNAPDGRTDKLSQLPDKHEHPLQHPLPSTNGQLHQTPTSANSTGHLPPQEDVAINPVACKQLNTSSSTRYIPPVKHPLNDVSKFDITPQISTDIPSYLHSKYPVFTTNTPTPTVRHTQPHQAELDNLLTKYVLKHYESIKLPYSSDQLISEQIKDDYLGPIYTYLKHHKLPVNKSQAKTTLHLSDSHALFYLKLKFPLAGMKYKHFCVYQRNLFYQ